MELAIDQRIYYSNKNHIPVRDIAESLLSLEQIIKQTPSVMEALFPGVKIDRAEVFISELKSGSLDERVLVKFFFGDQKKFDEFIQTARERLGIEKIMENPKILGSIIAAILLTMLAYQVGKDVIFSPEKKATIEANNNTIIQIGAGLVKMDSDDFKVLIENAVPPKERDRLAKHALKVMSPAKLDPDATITFNNDEDVRIESQTVKAVPSVIVEPEPDQMIQDYDNALVELRAVDLDSTKKGWAAVLPEINDRRTKVQLDPHVDSQDLMTNPRFRANITVVYLSDPSKGKVPSLIFIRDVRRQSPDM